MKLWRNDGYIKDRLKGISDPPRVFIEAQKATFQKDRVLILDLPDPGLSIDSYEPG